MHNAIKAFAKLTEKRDDVSLLIVGESFWQTLDSSKISTKIKNFKLISFIEPCEDISGDYFDVIPITDNKVLFAVGDICGKGVPAALLSSTAQAAIRSQLEYSSSPPSLAWS